MRNYFSKKNIGGVCVERVDITCVITGTRWEYVDVSQIQSLRELPVIVVVILENADKLAHQIPRSLARNVKNAKVFVWVASLV